MIFFRAIFGIVAVVALALVLGRTDHETHPVAFTYTWIGSIAVLLFLRFFF